MLFRPRRSLASGALVAALALARADGTFAPATSVPLPSKAAGPVVADVTGDRKPDLVLGHLETNVLSVLPGNGDGTFGAAITTAVDRFPTVAVIPVDVGDFDRDGKPDVVAVRGYAFNNVDVFFGDGAGRFPREGGISPNGVASGALAADLNADGKLDLLAVYGGADFIGSALGDGA